MKVAAFHENNSSERITGIKERHVSGPLSEEEFEDIAQVVSEITGSPVALMGMFDANRHWLKARFGLLNADVAAGFTHTTHAANAEREFLVVPNLNEDDRFCSDPHVAGTPYLVFYAQIPLAVDEVVHGILCIWDYETRELNERQQKALKAMGRAIACQLEMKKKVTQLKHEQVVLQSAYADLEKFSYIASHDLRGPLNNIISLTQLLKDDYGTRLDEHANQYIDYLNDAAYQLSDLVTGVLDYSRSSQILVNVKEDIEVVVLLEEVTGLLQIPANTTISCAFQKGNGIIHTSRIALKQILMNLMLNAIKYNDKEKIDIEVLFYQDSDSYSFEIRDNGPGIPEESRHKIFELFHRLQNSGGSDGSGIGLAIVKRLAEKLGGYVSVASEIGTGTTFTLSIPKEPQDSGLF